MAVKKKITEEVPTEKLEMDYAQMYHVVPELTKTGLMPLDTVLGGGYEAGDMISITSESGVGKSTMLITISKMFIERGEKVAYFDSEHGVKRSILENFDMLGLVGPDPRVNKFWLFSPIMYRDVELAFKDAVKFGFKHVIIDSMTDLAISNDDTIVISDDMSIGVNARVESRLYPAIKGWAKTNGVTVWIVQQTRTKMEKKGLSLAISKDSSGGQAGKFTPDTRIFLERGPKYIKESISLSGSLEKIELGNEARIWTEKNRNASPFIKIPCPIIYGKGVKNALYCQIILAGKGAISGGAGGVYSVSLGEGDPIKVKGKDNLSKWVSDNLETVTKFIIENGWDKLSIDNGVETVEE